MEEESALYGTVKWFDESQGYGLITPVHGKYNIVAHHSEVILEGLQTLNEGEFRIYHRLEYA